MRGDPYAEEGLAQEAADGAHSRFGIATKAGVGIPGFGSNRPAIWGAWLGGRYALRDRKGDGTGLNFAVAVLPGIQAMGAGPMAGLDVRFEVLAGNKMLLLEPTRRAYLFGGFTKALDSDPFEVHAGLGLGLDILFNRSDLSGVASIGVLGAGCPTLGFLFLGAALLISVPTLELVYTVRNNGESFPAVMIALGL